ncbi:MAG TPA: hypothetical protein VEJ00_04010 [Candidatus Acidoferrales bacterium]|nr:hypothetical protein [Candidatus Acidoferrales bacterium]
MRQSPAAILALWFFTLLLAATTVAAQAQSCCTALNTLKGEGKFTGQISTDPDGSSMQVSYSDQSVLVHYTSSVTVCQGGQPASVSALVRGASVSVFGPMRRNGTSMEIDAARIFVAGRLRTNPAPSVPNAQPTQSGTTGQLPPPAAKPNPEPALPNAQQTQPGTSGPRPTPNLAILRGGTHAETMQRLRVVRTYHLAELRANSKVTVGEAKLDFRPMLTNPKALFNIAQNLHAMPQHVQVTEETSEASEIEQGLVIHHVLSYHILPGKCGDANVKAQLDRAGAACFTRGSASERIAEFSKPGSPRYVADPGKRQTAIAAYQRNSALQDADATKHIAELRKALADPTQRAAIVAKIGQAEAARLPTLSDDQLKEEMINSAEQRFEETMYVPKLDSANYLHGQHNLSIAASPAEMAAAKQLLREGVHGGSPSSFPKLLKIVPSKHAGLTKTPEADKVADLDFGPYIYLTGFTLGRDHEWKWGASTTVNWCVVGCSATYGFDLWAGFGYGLGLRFPIQTDLKYHVVVHANNSAEASLTPTFKPIQGTFNDFANSGLSVDQIFNAQELVAEAQAHAGFDINLPGLNPSDDYKIGKDLTEDLPAPFTNGTFTPPAPGVPSPPGQTIFDQIDLLGGLLNFGVVGGQLFPALEITLFSNALRFTLDDEITNRSTTVASSGKPMSLGVGPTNGGDQSHFSFGDPVYNIGFGMTPGVAPNVFVDIGIWSHNWNFPIWFPELTVDLPPGGQDFSCHAGTTCVLDFQPVYNASTGQDKNMKQEMDVADRTLTSSGCQRVNNQEGNYLCPVKGMLGLCKAMLSNGAVTSCGPLVPNVVDEILKRGHCTDGDANYVCPSGMMGLCNDYLKNQEILSCTQAK